MKRLTAWVFVIALLPADGSVLVAGSSVSTADSLYRAAVDRMPVVPADESLMDFNRVLEIDPAYAPAYYQAAKLHMARKTPYARWRAELALTGALRLAPGNVDYRLAWAELRWVQGFREEAVKTYEEILEEYPDNVPAAYGLGARAVEAFIGLKDRGPSYREGSERYRRRAIDLLRWCIELDPEFREAYHKLGELYYEMGVPKGVVDVSEMMLKRDPHDKDALLLCGLGYQAMDRPEDALRCYTEARKYMETEEQAAMESVDVIADREERNAIAAADAGGSHGAELSGWQDTPERARFWRRQDPLYLTSVNERRMEHYSRFAYANISFGHPSRGVAGWRTDKGRTYIKFGMPLYLMTVKPDVSMTPSIDRSLLLDAGDFHVPDRIGMTQRAPGNSWLYEGFKISFSTDGVDQASFDWTYKELPKSGKFRFEDYLSSRHHFRHRPSRYVDPYRSQKYSVPYQVAAFREADRTRLEISYAIPKRKLGEPDGLLDLENGIFLFDGEWDESYKDVERIYEMESAGTDSLRSRYLLTKRIVYAEPGVYHVVVEARDGQTGSIGTFREERAYAFSDTVLATSDLMLASRIVPEAPFPDGREGLDILPNPLRVYHRTEPVRIYFEVYNLEKNEYGRTEYEVSYRVGSPEEEEVDASLFPELGEGRVPDPEGYFKVEVIEREDLPELKGSGPEEEAADRELRQIVDYRVTYVVPEKREVPYDASEAEEDSREVWETAITARYEGNREDDFTYLSIDVSRLPVGIHKLTVSVKDTQTGQTADQDVLFRTME